MTPADAAQVALLARLLCAVGLLILLALVAAIVALCRVESVQSLADSVRRLHEQSCLDDEAGGEESPCSMT